ncbi:MAG: class II histone deacetylase [Hyphomicrobiaceae bacterium]
MSSETIPVYWHDAVLMHDTGAGVFDAPPSDLLVEQTPHPENAVRVANMKRALEKGPTAPLLSWRAGRLATDAEICRFHTADFLADLEAANRTGRDFSRTTRMAPGAMTAIRAAAGTAIEAVAPILAGQTRKAHALVRPPGHHAAPAMVDGYCFLNNTALAAEAAIAGGMKRIAILDWDVHHGNGTQTGFYDRDDVLTISLHMDHGAWGPSHLETGGTEEAGSGKGKGFNVNIPFPYGAGDFAYRHALERIAFPRIRAFKPDLVVVANGQDANQYDPNGRACLSAKGFYDLALMTRALAEELTGGKLLSVQEGGYHPAYAALCAHATLEGFAGAPFKTPDPIAFLPEDRERAKSDVEAIAERLGL